MIGWQAVRDAASRLLSKHTAAAEHVEQDWLPPMPKDRGAEQGDVDDPAVRCCAASGPMDWRGRSIKRTATASRPRNQNAGISQLPTWRPEKLAGAYDPQRALQKNGGLADLWYVDYVSPDLGAVLLAGIRRRQRHSRSGAEPTANRSHLRRERFGCSAS